MPSSSCWQRWTRLLNEREAGTSLALFRIGVGLTVLATLLSIIGHGLAPAIWLDARDGGYGSLGDPPWRFALVGGVNPLTLWAMVTIALVSSACLTAGVCGRISAFVLLQSHQAITGINPATTGCDDQLIGNALWLLVLARSTATLSLSCRLRNGAWTSAELVPAWPRYLAIFQLIVVYFTTGIQKTGITWFPWGGWSALYDILQDPSWQRFDMSWLASVYPLTQAATAATWLWELSAPLLGLALWHAHQRGRDRCSFRRYYVLIGLGMHLGIWLLMGLGTFTWISCSFYFCLYAPTEWTGSGQASGGEQPMPSDRWSRWVVPVFVIWHLAAVSLGALPVSLPNRDADSRQEVERWTTTLADFRLDVDPEDFEEYLHGACAAAVRTRDVLVTPFKPYYVLCGVTQGWPMFTGSRDRALRLWIDIEEEGSWRPVYAQSVPEYAWRRSQFNHEHFRAAVYYTLKARDNATGHRLLAQWIARRAAVDFPHAARLRLRVEDFPVASPAEVRANRRPAGTESIVAEVALNGAR